MRSAIIIAGFLLPVTMLGQQTIQVPYERVLIPISIASSVNGAFGSVWTTDLVGRNESDLAVDISTDPTGLCTCPPPTAAHSTFEGSYFAADPNAGKFLYIGSPGLGKVVLHLRIRDLSRELSTWGTSIPTVREKDVFAGKLELLDIPTDSRFRAALRVYDFDLSAERVVRLRIYEVSGNTPLVNTNLTLTTTERQSSDAFPDSPATAMIGNLTDAFPALAGVNRLRIELDPVSPDLRFWAFVSVTNNETQHVTVIAP